MTIFPLWIDLRLYTWILHTGEAYRWRRVAGVFADATRRDWNKAQSNKITNSKDETAPIHHPAGSGGGGSGDKGSAHRFVYEYIRRTLAAAARGGRGHSLIIVFSLVIIGF